MPLAWAMLRALARRHALLVAGVALAFTFVRWPSFSGWDDSFYVAQLTSVVADRDLALHDDLLRLQAPLHLKLRMLRSISQSGALPNTFSIGPAVLHASYAWPLLVGQERPVSFALRAVLAAGALAMLVLTVLGLIALTERMGYSRGVARVAAVLAVALGPLALYGTRVTVDSHLPSALCGTLFLLALAAWFQTSALRHALAAGLAAGLLVITRWQEVVLILAFAPAVAVFGLRDGASRRARLLGAGLAAGACMLLVGVQLAAWRAQFGSLLLMPQGGGYMGWTDPAIAALLLSTYHGLLPWMPGFALGLLALLALPLPDRPHGQPLYLLGLRLAVVVVVYVSACPRDWWGGESFGPRRLTSLTPLVALGLAAVLARLRRPSVRATLIAVLALWAVFATTALLSGYDDISVVLFKTTSRYSPRTLDSYGEARWIDAMPTWPRVLRPGFTLSDHPRLADRLIGLAVAAFVVGGVVLAWSVLRRTRQGQWLAVVAVLSWSALALLWVVMLPSNARWDETWRATVQDQQACEMLSALPPGMDDARHVVCAARAQRAGDRGGMTRHLAAVRCAAEYGVDEHTLTATAKVEPSR